MNGPDRPRRIAVVGAFDTKGDELAFLAAAVREAGAEVTTVDCGVLGDSPGHRVDVPAAAVAEAGGSSLARLSADGDRAAAVAVMGAGATRILEGSVGAGRIHGFIAAGGSNAAAIATHVCGHLPFGVPKVIVSTMVAENTSTLVGGRDVVLFYPVADIEGLNHVSRSVLRRAGAAVAAMVSTPPDAVGRPRSLVAATASGTTTGCVGAARAGVEAAGAEMLVFHANGQGGRSYEDLLADGVVSACVDLSLTEITDEVAGGQFPAGPTRLGGAVRAGVPQVVAPGGADMVKFGPPDTVPARFRDRRIHPHNAHVTLVRADADESWTVGETIGRRLREGPGAVVLALPLGGVSALDVPGGVFEDPDADAALFAGLRAAAADLRIIESPHHLNDPEFGELLVRLLGEIHQL